MENPLTVVVPPELEGVRFDRALAVLLGISRGEARHLVESGATLDGRTVRARSAVAAGAVIKTPSPLDVGPLTPEQVDFTVVAESDAYLVVDKPPGVVVHPGSGHSKGTLAAGLLYRYPDLAAVGPAGRSGLVHRLDKDTSGLLLVARTDDALTALTADLAARRVKRTYLALVSGTMSIPTGTIDAPIGRDPNFPTRRAVLAGGKDAVTHYAVVQDFPAFEVTLLEVKLETGRTHQIRVHLAAIDHSIIGDATYGTRTTAVRSPRTFLHASSIEFTDPGSGSPVLAVSPIPPDLQAVLDGLGHVPSV